LTRSACGPTPAHSTNPNRETYVPPTVGVATVSGRFPGFPVHPGGRFAGRPVGWFPPSAGRLASPRGLRVGRGSATSLLMHVGPTLARVCAIGGWRRGHGTVGTERFPGGPSRDCTHRPRPTGQRAGAVHPGEIALASRHGATTGATICGQPVGHRPPGPTESGSQALPPSGGRSATAASLVG
jgi:hypothetical protein